MVQGLLDRTKAPDELDRTLVADARGARNVVDGVATQGHYVNHALWGYAEDLFDFWRVTDQVVLGRIQHQDAVIN